MFHQTLLAFSLVLSVSFVGVARAEEAPPPREVPVYAGVVAGNNAFAFDCYQQMAKAKSGGFVFSPHDLAMTMAVLRMGAGEKASADIARVMRWEEDAGTLARGFAALNRELSGKDSKVTREYEFIATASMWGQTGREFADPFATLLDKHFGAKVEHLDFRRDAAKAREVINARVSEATNGKIKKIATSDNIGPDAGAALLTTTYFRGTWARPFSESKTKELPFSVTAEKSVQLPMMTTGKEERIPYCETDTLQAVRLPYVKGEASMVFILPRKRNDLAAVERMLTAKTFQAVVSATKFRFGTATIPKFEAESRATLQNILPEAAAPFVRNTLYTGVFKGEGWQPNTLTHCAKLEVDERGTVAASATMTSKRLSLVRPQKMFEFLADHPFVYAVVDDRTGVILYLGRYAGEKAK